VPQCSEGRLQQVQQKHSRSAAAVSASRTAPPATQDSGRTTRGVASKEDPQRHRADRRKDTQTKRAADERVRKSSRPAANRCRGRARGP
jgi:hypothetical protein